MSTSQETVSRGQTGSGGALDNLTYDVITVIYEKSKGLEAYSKYMQDAQGNDKVSQIFQRMQQQDSQCVQELMQCLDQLQHSSGGGSSNS
jgi:hypothetical protein